MSWFLLVQDGNKFRDAAVLAEGQSLIIGRAETADLVFPNDSEMSSRHLSLNLRDGQCYFSDLHSTNGTFLDGEPVTEGTLVPDARLQCGVTVFTIESDHSARPPMTVPVIKAPVSVTGTAKSTRAGAGSPAEPLPQDVQQTEAFVSDSAIGVVQRFGLNESLTLDPDVDETPLQFSSRLLTSGGDNDCLNFLAYALPKRLGIWWALECLRSEDGLIPPTEIEMVKAVETWIVEPSDANRRQAMKLAEGLGMETAAAWAGVAAFWSHGSMAPEGQPSVPAKDEMTGKALAGSVILASVSLSPENAPKRRKVFVDIAKEVASGERDLPKT